MDEVAKPERGHQIRLELGLWARLGRGVLEEDGGLESVGIEYGWGFVVGVG